MGNRIPEEVVEQIRTSSDIVEVIGEYVQLRKQGVTISAFVHFMVRILLHSLFHPINKSFIASDVEKVEMYFPF